MNNVLAMDFFKNMAKSKDNNPNSVKLAHNTNCTVIDAKFILKYTDSNSKILDIGTGSGLIINLIYDKVKSIDCIEPYKEFTKFIVKSDNILIHNCNIFDYKTDKFFDIVTSFGTMHYFNENEAFEIYKIVYSMLKVGGKFIIKNQFGIYDDVDVSGYSEEQKTEYFAQYRYIDKEINMLKGIGFKNISKYDIYPAEINRWDNTHFWAIAMEK